MELGRQIEALHEASPNSLHIRGGGRGRALRDGVGEEERPATERVGAVGRRRRRRRRDAGAAVGRGRGIRVRKPEFDGGGVAEADINGGEMRDAQVQWAYSVRPKGKIAARFHCRHRHGRRSQGAAS